MSDETADTPLPKVVIYRSAITDIRTVEARLRRAQLPFEVEVMSMAGQDERKRYRDLKQSSGYSTLPLIFIDGSCVGGEPELARYLAAQGEGTEAPAAATPPLAPDQDRADEGSAPATKESAVSTAEEVVTPEPPAQAADDSTTPAVLQQHTAWLGYAGLLPFVTCALASLFGPVTALAQLALVAYGAVIFSFVGAVHWGYSLGQDPRHPRGLVASVVPSLIGWVALAVHSEVGPVPALALLAVSFAFWHLFERTSRRLPPHYLALRLRLTAIVVALLGGTSVAHLAGLASG